MKKRWYSLPASTRRGVAYGLMVIGIGFILYFAGHGLLRYIDVATAGIEDQLNSKAEHAIQWSARGEIHEDI